MPFIGFCTLNVVIVVTVDVIYHVKISNASDSFNKATILNNGSNNFLFLGVVISQTSSVIFMKFSPNKCFISSISTLFLRILL